MKRRKKHKYNAQRTAVDDILFDSKAEAQVFKRLRTCEAAHRIFDLQRQVRFTMEVNGKKICTFIVDFTWCEPPDERGHIQHVAADVKGVRTPVYKLKAKLFAAIFPNYKFLEM